MRSLEQIHLDSVKAGGSVIDPSRPYLERLASVAAYRWNVSSEIIREGDRFALVCRNAATGVSRTPPVTLSPGPSESPVAWNPETDIPEGNRPKLHAVAAAVADIRVGDRINYTVNGSSGMWDGSLVTGIVKKEPFKGQLYVTAPGGELGIIAPSQAELVKVEVTPFPIHTDEFPPTDEIPEPAWGFPSAPPAIKPQSRSTGFRTVGCYQAFPDSTQYKRLALRSIPDDLGQELELEYLDSLIQTCAVENNLDVAQLFTMQRADIFEGECREGQIIT